MLILSRRLHQEIVIGDGIVVTVVSIDPERVRLGVTAPKEVPVDRREVHDAKMADILADDLGGDAGAA